MPHITINKVHKQCQICRPSEQNKLCVITFRNLHKTKYVSKFKVHVVTFYLSHCEELSENTKIPIKISVFRYFFKYFSYGRYQYLN